MEEARRSALAVLVDQESAKSAATGDAVEGPLLDSSEGSDKGGKGGEGGRACRICLSRLQVAGEDLVTPCQCRGTMAFVHVSCLERWLSQTRTDCCELCQHRFRTVATPMYGRMEALHLWLRHPAHTHRIREEVVLTTALTGAMLLLSLSSMIAVHYFLNRTLAGLTSRLMIGLISFLVVSILAFYSFTLYAIFRAEFQLWRAWWRSAVNIKVLLSPLASTSSSACALKPSAEDGAQTKSDSKG